MKFFIASTFGQVVLLGLVFQAIGQEGQGGGYVDFLCPADGVTLPENVLSPCAKDCMNLHGALGGKCGNVSERDFNCYCQGLSNIPTPPAAALHCQAKSKAFADVCTQDCICSHGADGGHCNWENRQCICDGQGHNKQNIGCIAHTSKDLALYILNEVGPEYLGQYGNAFVQCVLFFGGKNCEEKILKAAECLKEINAGKKVEL